MRLCPDFMLRSKVLSFIVAVLIIAAALPTLAEEQKDDENNVFTLGKVEVTGKEQKQKNSAVTSIGQEEMLEFDRKTVAEAANLISGVTLSRSGGRNESMLYLRGFDIKHAPLYIDGIPIYVPYDGYPDLGRFFTYDLSQIDISKGFASVLYGPNTMGGAINLVSRRPSKAFEGNAGAGYTSGHAYQTFANFGSNQKTWYVQGGGSWVDMDSYEMSDDFKATKAENGNKRNNSYQRDAKGSVKVGFTPNSTDEYAISYVYQHGEKGVPPYAGKNTAPSAIKYWQWPFWDKQSLYLNTNTAIGDKSYVKTRVYYDKFKNSLEIFDDANYQILNYAKGNKSWYDDYTVGGSIEAGTTLIPYNSLKAAFHMKDDVHREWTSASPRQHYEDMIYSIALEDTIQIAKKLSAVIGVSYDLQKSQKAQDYNPLPGTTGPKVLHDLPTETAHAFNPQASFFYEYSDSGKVHASVAFKSRFPSIKDKYSYRFGTYIPNPDLKSEKSVNYELGVEDTIANAVKVKGNFFISTIKDYIQAVNITSTTYQNQNFGKVNRYGYEIEALAPIGEMVETGMNYTFIYNDNRSNKNEITDVPKHKLFAYAKVTPIKPLSILTSAEYNTKRFSSTDGKYIAGEYVVLNLKASYEVIKDLNLEAGVNNLLDRNYALTEGYPEPGRNYFFQARYRF